MQYDEASIEEKNENRAQWVQGEGDARRFTPPSEKLVSAQEVKLELNSISQHAPSNPSLNVLNQ